MRKIYIIESNDGLFWIAGYGLTNRVTEAEKFNYESDANAIRLTQFNPDGWIVRETTS